jgi:DNA invertase Pin-like site-specific DNA recombinase
MKFISYYRVSTNQQGQSGLGLEAQRQAVMNYLNGGKIIAEFTEVESGKRSPIALSWTRLWPAPACISVL